MAVTANRYACHQNIGPAALVSAWTEVALATIVVALRFGTQFWIVKRIGLDDWIMLFALVRGIHLVDHPRLNVVRLRRYSIRD